MNQKGKEIQEIQDVQEVKEVQIVYGGSVYLVDSDSSCEIQEVQVWYKGDSGD